MTASSPLAALHRPMPAPAWGGRDIFRSHYAGNSASGSLSLREQLHKGTGEYLDVKVRGSSPAGSLAADISQNFRLDNEASPKFPTPRRALFTANVMGGVSSRDFVTTPPLPPSSPSQRTEILESSPLPHKVTFSEVVEIASPTPISCLAKEALMLDSPAPITRRASLDTVRSRSRHASLEPTKPIVAETRKQFRRSLSMFESPADVMKPKTEKGLADAPILKSSVADIEEAHEPTLPHFLPDDPTDTIPRITRETMLAILDGKYSDKFAQRMVIDCRFEYEYEGGHIDSAVNHNDKELLADQLFQTPMDGLTLLIFHCEYSAHRAPLMARHIRSHDRTINAEHYPRLTYPEIYILDGGYSGFFAEHRARCFPPEYVEMSDEKHQRTCEREMGRLKARKPFGRAQTFAFGQRNTSLHDSPTGPPRPHSRNVNESPAALSTTDSPTVGDRTQTRRMASY
ncbi:hypothetical protein TrVFT333_008674 [Trichoderma virens FT-333]|nr:hypothetical protein TrVFT333_008674 [Trichoderma virens FT-333]